MKTYRVAIVGLGRMGSTLEQSIASACLGSRRLRLVAGADTIPSRQAEFRKKWGVPAVYHDYQEMIEKEHPDLVAVCTTATGLAKPGNQAPSNEFRNDAHADIAIQAIHAGVPMLFVEKAMSCSVRKADEVLRACKQLGTVFNTGVLRRFNEHYHATRNMIMAGDIGEPKTVVVYGTANLMHTHIHSIDTLSFLLGDPKIRGVRGDLLPRRTPIERNRLTRDPRAMFQISFANGIEAWSAPAGGGEYEIIGTEGAIRTMRDGSVVAVRRGNSVDEWPIDLRGVSLPPIAPVSAVICCLENLVSSYESGQPSRGNVEITHHITEACITVAESHRQENKYIQLPMENRDLYIFHV